MPERGLEPPPSYLDKNLNLARLPIPPLGQVGPARAAARSRPFDATRGLRIYNWPPPSRFPEVFFPMTPSATTTAAGLTGARPNPSEPYPA